MDKGEILETIYFIIGFTLVLGGIATALICLVVLIWTDSVLAGKIGLTSLVGVAVGLLMGQIYK